MLKKLSPKADRRPWIDAGVVLLLGASLWTWTCIARFPADGLGAIWGRGALLLLAVFVVTRLFGLKGFFDLLFPILWLAASPALRNLCGSDNVLYWIWALGVLLSTALVLAVKDARWLLAEIPLWAGMTFIMSASFVMPLAFLMRPAKPVRMFREAWKLPALAGIAVLINGALAWRGRGFLQSGWLDVYDLLTIRHSFAFVLLALLGFFVMGRKGFSRQAFLQVFLVMAGWCLWPSPKGWGPAMDAMGVTFVWLAGPGLKVLRDELLDDSWHGRAVWAVLGTMLLLALFKGA